MTHLSDRRLRSRLAPTPSGYLHRGNLYSFLFTWLSVRSRGGSLHLRIDDMDRSRVKPAYVEDIFRSLEALGLDWDSGPIGPDDFEAHWSQRHFLGEYREALARLKEQNLIYPCTCSRREIRRAFPAGDYHGKCRSLSRQGFSLGGDGGRLEYTWRLKASDDGTGDYVVWRRDNLPAYQLFSVVDDHRERMNLLIRGEDLRDSTAKQEVLWGLLYDGSFPRVHYHPLITDAAGGKLSKSAGSQGVSLFSEVTPLEVLRDFSRWMGVAEPWGVQKVADLLEMGDQCPKALT